MFFSFVDEFDHLTGQHDTPEESAVYYNEDGMQVQSHQSHAVFVLLDLHLTETHNVQRHWIQSLSFLDAFMTCWLTNSYFVTSFTHKALSPAPHSALYHLL